MPTAHSDCLPPNRALAQKKATSDEVGTHRAALDTLARPEVEITGRANGPQLL